MHCQVQHLIDPHVRVNCLANCRYIAIGINFPEQTSTEFEKAWNRRKKIDHGLSAASTEYHDDFENAMLAHFKATEFSQYLLYLGPVIFHKRIETKFLFLKLYY